MKSKLIQLYGGVINSFRILKALIIEIPNQIWKVMEETLRATNSDAVKTKLRGLLYFKMILSFLQVLEKHLLIPLSLCHI